MPTSIYYPRTPSSSKKIAQKTCPADMTSEEFERMFLAANGKSPDRQCVCSPSKPVVVPPSAQDRSVSIAPLKACTDEQRQTLSHMSHYAGGATVMGLANLLSDTKIPEAVGDLTTFGGNGMGSAVAQSDRVLGAINKYDLANKHYEDLKNHRAAPRTLNAAKTRAQAAFKEMNQVLNEKSLNYLNNNTFGMRQTTNATGRTVQESIPVRNTMDVEKLAKFAKAGRVAGPGFIVFDGYLRGKDVYQSWQNNDPNWQRKAVVQGVSFGAGIYAGAAIATVIAITPVGLAIGIVAGGAAAVGIDYGVKEVVGGLYDWW